MIADVRYQFDTHMTLVAMKPSLPAVTTTMDDDRSFNGNCARLQPHRPKL